MLITKTVMVRWHGNNRKHYEGLGYKFTKIGDEEVDISYQTTDIYLDANVQEEAVAKKQVASLMIGLDKFQITDIVCLNPIKPEPEPEYPETGETDIETGEGH